MKFLFNKIAEESAFAGLLRRLFSAQPSFESSRLLQPLRHPAHERGEGAAVLTAVLLLWAAVFIPRLSLGALAGHYSIALKMEDVLLTVLAGLFFWQSPQARTGFAFRIEASFLFFLICAAFSIGAGIYARTLDKPLMSVLVLLKWFQYFLVFALILRLSRTPRAARIFLTSFFLLGIALAGYGWFEHFYPVSKGVYPNYYRLYERPPFHGDANHIGGLLAVWLSFFSCALLRLTLTPTLSPKGRGRSPQKSGVLSNASLCPSPVGRGQGEGMGWQTQCIILVAIVFVFFPFIWTFSRKSYFAFAAAYGFMFFLPGISRRRWIFLACLLICAAVLLPTRLVERLSDLGQVLSETDPYHSSWAGNLDVWRRSFWNFDQFWLFGSGMGARHRLFYESQYVMTLTETGVTGFTALLLLLALPAWPALRNLKAPGLTGIAAGAWLAAWAAFGVHNLSCVSLTVSKTAVTWWFLTGTVMGALESARKETS